MKSAARRSETEPLATGPSSIDDAGAHPAAGDIVMEIGLLLAIHLAAAFAIGLSLRVLGIG